ncbi:hypothetical protein ACFLZ8_04390 [Planctomycetota bacterium]
MSETDSVKFQCEYCGCKISINAAYAGKKGRCPKCKNVIIVPEAKSVESASSNALDDLLDYPKDYKLKDEPIPDSQEKSLEQKLYEESESEETEPTGQHRLPWFIDVFLYPVSFSGLTHLAVFTLIPWLVNLLTIIVIKFFGRAGMIVGLAGLIINILNGLYFGWYFTECVRDSAKGQTRAPESFPTVGAREMWSQTQHIVGCCLIFLSPSLFYSFYTHRTDGIYWGLLITGSFFLPG